VAAIGALFILGGMRSCVNFVRSLYTAKIRKAMTAGAGAIVGRKMSISNTEGTGRR